MFARKVIFCFGKSRVRHNSEWLYELQGSELISDFEDFSMTVQYGPSRPRRERETRKHEYSDSPGGVHIGVWDTATYLRQVSATDPRDLIYSAVGFMNDPEASLIEIDYNMPCSKVFARATWASMKVREDCQILLLVSLGDQHKDGSPSWAVDFSASKDVPKNISLHNWGLLPCYDVLNQLELGAKLDAALDQMTISGVYCEAVTSVVPLGRDLPTELEGVSLLEMKAVMRRAIESLQTSVRKDETELAAATAGRRLLRRQFNYWIITPRDDGGWRRDESNSGMHHLALAEAVLSGFRLWSHTVHRDEHQDHVESRIGIREFFECARFAANGTSFFASASGIIGFAPSGISAGDRIVLLQGDHPFLILRRCGNLHEFRGLAYVHGFMDDWTFWADQDLSRFKEQRFVLR